MLCYLFSVVKTFANANFMTTEDDGNKIPQQRGVKIVWGYNEAPKLPDAWRVERNPQAAAVAVSPDGNEYLIGDGVLYPYLKCPPEGLPLSPLKPGQRYIDIVKAIKMPNVEPRQAADDAADCLGSTLGIAINDIQKQYD
jgi:hypothetical protein